MNTHQTIGHREHSRPFMKNPMNTHTNDKKALHQSVGNPKPPAPYSL